MFKCSRYLQLCIVLALTVPAHAGDRDAVIAELREQIAQLADRLSALESDRAKIDPECCKNTSGLADRFSFKGDVRYRYENIEDDRKIAARNRSRVRARAAVVAQVNENFKVGIGVASGGSDPRSSNQTLGDGGSTKDLRLDLAYIDWQLTDSLSLTAGKMKNPFHRAGKHPLVWDSDYRPEGVSVKFDNGQGFYLAGSVNLLESDNRSGSGDAETGWGLQSGFERRVGESTQIHAGGSYYHYPVSGSEPFFADKAYGNSLAPDGTYLFDYDVLELFAEISFDLESFPVSLFANVINNQDADSHDMGWAFGINVGNTSAKGTWEIGYRYQDLEADAWFGLPVDSDFGGGGTDTSGHVVKVGYALNKNSAVKLTYILSEYGAVSRGTTFDYDRLQMDLSLKF